MRRNIVFIGMMGTFKTATAERVAAALHMPLVDTDAVFEQRFMPIDAYFAAHGEAAFREEESRIVAEVAASENTVISCGGGAVLRRENVDALKNSGVVVLLTASDEAIIARVGKAETRPLLKADVENNVRRIAAARRDLYAACADITVDNTDLTVDACCARVLAALRDYGYKS